MKVIQTVLQNEKILLVQNIQPTILTLVKLRIMMLILSREDLCGQRCSDTSEHADCPRITDEQIKVLFERYLGHDMGPAKN